MAAGLTYRSRTRSLKLTWKNRKKVNTLLFIKILLLVRPSVNADLESKQS